MLFVALRAALPSLLANVVALTVTAVANTAANRRLTFGIRGSERWWRHHAQALVIFGAGVVVTTITLIGVHTAGVHGGVPETLVLTIANLAVTAGRFAAMRWWIFPGRTSRQQHGNEGTREPGQELVA